MSSPQGEGKAKKTSHCHRGRGAGCANQKAGVEARGCYTRMAASDMPSLALTSGGRSPGERRASVERGRSVTWVEPHAEVEVQYNELMQWRAAEAVRVRWRRHGRSSKP